MSSRGRAGNDPYAARPWLADYPEGVPAHFDFPVVPVTRLLDDAAASFPERTALAFLGATLTYRELKEQVDAFAVALADLGVVKGDRVAIVLPNCPQNVIALFGALRLGAVVVQHNPLYTEPELRHQLADCGATVVICLDRVLGTVLRVARDTALQHVVVTSIADYLPRAARLALRLPMATARRKRRELTAAVPKGTALSFTALLRSATGPARQATIDPEHDLALLQYTGGTTGVSRGAMLTHHNVVSNAYMNRLWDTGAVPGREVTLGVLPLFHAYGLTVCLTSSVLLGGTLVLLPRFDLDAVFDAIEQHRPTALPGVPPIYQALADSQQARTRDLSSIRFCVSGAMRLPPEVQERFERVSGARLVEGYGLTEASPVTHAGPVSGPRRPGIGLPLTGTRVRVVDQDDPTVAVPVGTPGEMAIGGPQVFRGYWGQDDAAGVFTDDGFVLTGDVVVMDADGWFTVVDRKKELVVTGGFNVYPSEVEDVLLSLPGVAEAVVVGLPDRHRGEAVAAFLVLAPGSTLTEDDVMVHCRASLTAFKLPRHLELRASLPRTAVGKVLRRALVEEVLARESGAAASPASARARARGSRAAREAEALGAGTSGAPATAPVAERPSTRPPRKASVTKAVPTAPVEKAVRKAPGSTAAAKRAPAKRAPAKEVPVKEVPVKEVPAKEVPARRAPVAKAAVTKAPSKNASVARAPETGTPATQEPAERARSTRPRRTPPPG